MKTRVMSNNNKDQSNLAKGDIFRLIMTSGTAHGLSIIFARWQDELRSWFCEFIWDPHYAGR